MDDKPKKKACFSSIKICL